MKALVVVVLHGGGLGSRLQAFEAPLLHGAVRHLLVLVWSFDCWFDVLILVWSFDC